MSANNSKGYPMYDIRLVREMTEEDITRLLTYTVLGNCHTIGGRKMPNDADLLIDAQAVANEIKSPVNSNYGGWFAEEIKQAMWEGAKGKFGEYFGLNLKTYTQFLISWESSDLRKKWRVLINAEYRKFGPKQIGSERTSSRPPMTEAELRKAILGVVDEFKSGKSFREVFISSGVKGSSLRKIIDSAKSEVTGSDTNAIAAAYVTVADRLGMQDEADYLDSMCRKFGVVIEYANLDW